MTQVDILDAARGGSGGYKVGRRRIRGNRLRNGHGRIQVFDRRWAGRDRSAPCRGRVTTLSRTSNKGVMRHLRARRQRRAFFVSELAHVHARF